MGEVYSQLWVKIKCHYDAEQKSKIGKIWQSLLAKYRKYDILDDKHEDMFQKDGIHFGIAADTKMSEKPNYEMQYQMFGEFVRAIQEILIWEFDLHIQKTGASG